MLKRLRRWNLLLNLLFAVWAAYFMVSGQLLPSAIEELLRPEQPISVSVEPENLPDQITELPLDADAA